MHDSDGVIRNTFHFSEHEEKLYVKQDQPTENLILDRNRELRKNPGCMNNLKDAEGREYGQLLANIPNIMYYKYKDKYDLNSNEGMAKFLLAEDGKKCLVR